MLAVRDWRLGPWRAVLAIVVGTSAVEARQTATPPPGTASRATPPIAAGTAPEKLPMPPRIQTILNRRKAAMKACAHDDCPAYCRYAARTDAAGELIRERLARPFAPHTGFFALREPYQFIPPPINPAYLQVPPLPNQKAPLPTPMKLLFRDNDYSYLDNPDSVTLDPYDFIKRIPLTPRGTVRFDAGGEFRWLAKGEANSRLSGKENNYNLFRELVYLNTQITENFRFYTEGIFADSSRQTLRPLITDNNHGDFLEAFGELTVWRKDKAVLTGSFGRQMLSFGNQRLVSALDWVNTRRTFDDVARLKLRSKQWDMDLFWSRPNIIRPRALDRANLQQQFFGYYSTYKGFENQLIDLYYLGLLNDARTAIGSNGVKGKTGTHTLGTRWQGEYQDRLLYETEIAYQFGHYADRPINAGMATAGAGWRFAKITGKPEAWFYWDYASGTQNNRGTYETFNQLFPLGHKYFGFVDLVGRQNINSPSAYLFWKPNKRVAFYGAYHFFELASANDALYNAGGIAIRNGRGRAGTNVGNEWDFLMNIYINPHTDFQLSYNLFTAGSFLNNTGIGGNSQLFYSMFIYRF